MSANGVNRHRPRVAPTFRYPTSDRTNRKLVGGERAPAASGTYGECHLTAKRWQESRVMRTEIPQGETGYGGQPDSQGPRRDRVGRHAALPKRLQHVGVAQEGRPLVARVGGSVPLRGLTPYAMMS